MNPHRPPRAAQPAPPPSSHRITHHGSRITFYVSRFTPSAALLSLAALLRLYRLGAAPLRGDEAFAVAFSAFSWSDMLRGMALTEPNPPLYWLLLRGWMSLAGSSEAAVRLLSVLAGLAVVALTYRLARALLPRPLRRAGALAAAFLAAVNPFLIWHAQDARVYSLLAAFAVGAAWLTLRAAGMEAGAAGRPARLRDFFLPAGLWWLALFAHYFAALPLAAVGLAVLASPEGRARWKPALAALALLALAYLPWALYAGPLLLDHTKDWIQPLSLFEGLWRTAVAFTGGLTLAGPWRVAAGLAGGAFAGLGALYAIRRSQAALPLLAWGPPALLGLLSLWRPAFDERFVIGALPAALVLQALPLAAWPRLPRLAGLALLAGLAALSLTNYYFNPAFAKSPDWPGLAAYLREAAAPTDLIVEDFQDPAFAYYYAGPASVSPAPRDSQADQQARLEAMLRAHPRIWFFLSDATVGAGAWLDDHAERLADGRVRGFRLQVFDSPAGSLAARVPFEVAYEDGVQLAGYRLFVLSAPDLLFPEGAQVAGGSVLHVTLYWQAAAPVSRDYTVFTHFVAADGFRAAGHDGPPGLGRSPSSGWQPGEIVVDPHDLEIPAGLAPGRYAIRVGLYDPATGRRLRMVNSGDDFVTLPVVVEVLSP